MDVISFYGFAAGGRAQSMPMEFAISAAAWNRFRPFAAASILAGAVHHTVSHAAWRQNLINHYLP